MITRIEIDGFKSFSNFHMDFAPLTVIAGANASGKSNLFDAIHLLSRLATAENINRAFGETLRGEPIELFTQYADGSYAEEMSFAVEMLVDKKGRNSWGKEITLSYTRLRYELVIKQVIQDQSPEKLFVFKENLAAISFSDDTWLHSFIPTQLQKDWQSLETLNNQLLPFISYQPTPSGLVVILLNDEGEKDSVVTEFGPHSVLKSIVFSRTPHVQAAKDELRNWQVFQLDPEALRKPSPRFGETVLGRNGENLAAVLHRIKLEDPDAIPFITRKLNSLIPKLVELEIVDDKAENRYVLKIRQSDGPEFYARVLSEGTLRMLALCVLLYDESHHGVICLEEPENGVHPFRIKAVAQLLQDITTDFTKTDFPLRQVIINTHSPTLLNEVVKLSTGQTLGWFFEPVTRVGDANGKRQKWQITCAIPIETKEVNHLNLFSSENEKKFSLHKVSEYLKNTDFEATRTQLEP